MLLAGYHGTTQASADNILRERKFTLSTSETEWLGDGIYFYEDINDAYDWKECEAIIHCVIELDSSRYLDLDTEVGKDVYLKMEKHICSTMGVSTSKKNAQENQCALMKMIWKENPSLYVLAASFATKPTEYKTLLDMRPRRREFCVRNNDGIKFFGLIKRSDLA